jgi:acyl carrier protein
MNDTFEQIQSVLSKMLEIPPGQITLETKRPDLANWDSLKHLNITMELEAVCGVVFTLNEMATLNSVRQIVNIIDSKTRMNTERRAN